MKSDDQIFLEYCVARGMNLYDYYEHRYEIMETYDFACYRLHVHIEEVKQDLCDKIDKIKRLFKILLDNLLKF